jgi:hypothetical protein
MGNAFIKIALSSAAKAEEESDHGTYGGGDGDHHPLPFPLSHGRIPSGWHPKHPDPRIKMDENEIL